MAIERPVAGVPRAAAGVELACFPTKRGSFGAFLRGYRGPDPYNLGFLDTIARVEAGLTFSQDGFFQFRRPK